jgi:hypothetical protein
VSWPRPGEPAWSGFTAFCANEVTLFAADKLGVLTLQHLWTSTVTSLFVGGVVYGRAKVDELRHERNGTAPGSSR